MKTRTACRAALLALAVGAAAPLTWGRAGGGQGYAGGGDFSGGGGFSSGGDYHFSYHSPHHREIGLCT